MIDIEDIGLRDDGRFVDLDNRDIELSFKLYPWEWMFHDAFGGRLPRRRRAGSSRHGRRLSNKGMLPLLWEMFPGHPNLLPAFFEDDPNAAQLGTSFVRKPLYSREGANVTLVSAGVTLVEQEGPYGAEGLFVRRWRRCRIFRTNIRCWEAGWSITRHAGYRSARTKIRSPATRRGSCRTRSSRLADESLVASWVGLELDHNLLA